MFNYYEQMIEKNNLYKNLILTFILTVLSFLLFAYGLVSIFYFSYYISNLSIANIILAVIATLCSAIAMGFNVADWSVYYEKLRGIE